MKRVHLPHHAVALWTQQFHISEHYCDNRFHEDNQASPFVLDFQRKVVNFVILCWATLCPGRPQNTPWQRLTFTMVRGTRLSHFWIRNEIPYGSNKPPKQAEAREMSRRRFIKMGALAALAWAPPMPCFGASPEPGDDERILFFYNTHTKETLKAVYWIDGAYVPSALEDIDYILRDHRTGETIRMDRLLLDLLHTLAVNVDATQPLHIISGYRSPKTNAMLRKNGRGRGQEKLPHAGKSSRYSLAGMQPRLAAKGCNGIERWRGGLLSPIQFHPHRCRAGSTLVGRRAPFTIPTNSF